MSWLAVGVTAFGVASSLQQGQAGATSANASAAANKYNAAVARQRAKELGKQYNRKEEQQRRSAALDLGEQRGFYSQAGVGTGGSTAAVERQSALFAELDALNLRRAGQYEIRSALSDADMQDFYARVNKQSARNSKIGGYLGAGAALFGGSKAGGGAGYGFGSGGGAPKTGFSS